MKTLLISSLLAVSSVFVFAAPSYADMTTVTTTQKVVREPMRGDNMRYHHRVAHDCFMKKVRTHHHGRVVVKETRVCR